MDKSTLLNKYFEGSLSQVESREFTHLLETDSEFASDFKFEKDLQVALKKEERQKLKTMLKELNQEKAKPETKVFQLRPWLAAASIAMLIGLGSWFLFFNSPTLDTNELYASNFMPYDNVISPIERGSDIIDLQQQAFMAYENMEYEHAFKLFTQLKTEVKDPYIDFYQANILMKLDKHQQAIVLLESYIKKEGMLADRATWYLSLCYLKLKKIEVSKAKLKTLIKMGTFKNKAAQELLSQLD